MDFDAEFVVDVLCHVLGGIDTTVLSSCASKGKHEMGESSVDESLHMEID